jgi:twinkle protein
VNSLSTYIFFVNLDVEFNQSFFLFFIVNQVTGIPAVSLPNGCRSLPDEVLPLLERFIKIYLWMDNDEPGIEGSMKIAQRLGLHRCFIVRPTCHPAPKDANEALLQGFDMKKFIEEAERVRHTHVVGFKSLRDEVLHQILNPKMYVGTSSTSLPALTKIVKGFREGELSILTGPTGSGKVCAL